LKENSFKFRESFGRAFLSMPDKQAGKLIKALCIYAFRGKPVECKDSTVQSSFILIKTAMDADEKDRENGRKGGLISAEQIKRTQPSSDVLTDLNKQRIIYESAAELFSVLLGEEKPAKNYERKKRGRYNETFI